MTDRKLPKPTLPYGWVVKQSQSYPDRVYYFNINTGASTWEKPAEFKELERKQNKSVQPATRPSKPKVQNEKIKKVVSFHPSDVIEAKFSPEPDVDNLWTPNSCDDLDLSLSPVTSHTVPPQVAPSYTNSRNIPSHHSGTHLGKKVARNTPNVFPDSKSSNRSSSHTWLSSRQSTDPQIQHPKNPITPQNNFTVPELPAHNHQEGDHVNRKRTGLQHPPQAALETSNSHRVRKFVPITYSNTSEASSANLVKNCASNVSRKESRKRTLEDSKDDSAAKKIKPDPVDSNVNKKKRKKKKKNKKPPDGDQRKVISRLSTLEESSLSKDDSQDSPENPLISDPEKLRSIQVWINQCEPDDLPLDSVSDILDQDSIENRPSPDSGNLSLVESDSRRVVISNDKLPQRTVDSGISSISNVTDNTRGEWKFEFQNKTPNLSWKGVHSQNATVDTSRAESVPMEIDEVQQVLHSHDEREVESMDVSEIALKEVREQVKKCPQKVMGVLTESVCSQQTPRHTETQGLIVVVDTNVLISDLGFVEDLRDQVFDNYGKPILLIPWVVMQELDALKDKKSTSVNLSYSTAGKARASVSFLYNCFESRHPRVIGQTPNQASEAATNFKAECNDDRVLQCCLQCQKNRAESKVILLTNDKNLSSKATIVGMTSYSRWGLLAGMNKKISTKEKSEINKSSAENQEKDIRKIKASSPDPLSKSEWERTLMDDMLCKVKLWLKDSLSVVLETEMKAVYDDIWLTILFRKPPWSLSDVLECFKKHWMAVFGYIYQRSVYNNVEKLCSRFRPSQKCSLTVEDMGSLVDDSMILLQQCHNHRSTDILVTEALQGMEKLQQLCSDLKDGAISNISLQSYLEEKPKILQRQKSMSDDAPIASASSTPEPVDTSMEHAEKKLTQVWEIVFNYCNGLQKFLDAYNKDTHKEQLSQVLMVFRKLVPAVKGLRFHYSRALTFSPEEIIKQPANVHDLSVQINGFFVQMEIQEGNERISVPQLKALFSRPEKRTLLQLGLDQLDKMIIKLHEMISLLPDS